jgi:hypothetical protein
VRSSTVKRASAFEARGKGIAEHSKGVEVASYFADPIRVVHPAGAGFGVAGSPRPLTIAVAAIFRALSPDDHEKGRPTGR